MPRQARLDFSGCLHHIINRGIERRRIFMQQDDYRTFVEYLGELVENGKHKCSGWVLMSNHFHLLVETGQEPISRFMSRLLTRYAGYFNRRHRRCGRLFQNRYKSIVCDKDSYFKELVAYIHLNPLRAGLVKSVEDLGNYRWSGQRALIGKEKYEWQSVQETLTHFGGRAGRYLEYLSDKKGLKRGEFSGGGLIRSAGGLEVTRARRKTEHEKYDTRILGDEDFVEGVLRKHENSPGTKMERLRITLDDLINRIAEVVGVEVAELYKRGKTSHRGSEARGLLTYLSARYFKIPLTDMAGRLGISQPAASKLYKRGEGFLQSNRNIFSEIIEK